MERTARHTRVTPELETVRAYAERLASDRAALALALNDAYRGGASLRMLGRAARVSHEQVRYLIREAEALSRRGTAPTGSNSRDISASR
jgi:hypothetical protein